MRENVRGGGAQLKEYVASVVANILSHTRISTLIDSPIPAPFPVTLTAATRQKYQHMQMQPSRDMEERVCCAGYFA